LKFSEDEREMGLTRFLKEKNAKLKRQDKLKAKLAKRKAKRIVGAGAFPFGV